MRYPRRKEDGFTVVEVLVAVVNLGMVLLAINAVLLAGFTQAAVSKATSDATAVAQRQIETLRDLSYANIQSAPTTTVTVGAYVYTVNRTVIVNDPAPNIKHIIVTVTWTLQGARSYVAETYFSDAGR